MPTMAVSLKDCHIGDVLIDNLNYEFPFLIIVTKIESLVEAIQCSDIITHREIDARYTTFDTNNPTLCMLMRVENYIRREPLDKIYNTLKQVIREEKGKVPLVDFAELFVDYYDELFPKTINGKIINRSK